MGADRLGEQEQEEYQAERIMKRIDINKDFLIKRYLEEGATPEMIGREVGASDDTIGRRLREYDIKVRTQREAYLMALERGRVLPPADYVLDIDGYPRTKRPGHHHADHHGYVKVHILVWEEANGRLLPPGWVVHHINGIKIDFRPENLFAFHTAFEHLAFHSYARRMAGTGQDPCPPEKLAGYLKKWHKVRIYELQLYFPDMDYARQDRRRELNRKSQRLSKALRAKVTKNLRSRLMPLGMLATEERIKAVMRIFRKGYGYKNVRNADIAREVRAYGDRLLAEKRNKRRIAELVGSRQYHHIYSRERMEWVSLESIKSSQVERWSHFGRQKRHRTSSWTW